MNIVIILSTVLLIVIIFFIVKNIRENFKDNDLLQKKKIYLKKIKYYYLTCSNKVRIESIENEFIDYDLTQINNLTIGENIGKNKSGAIGFSKMIDTACKDQDINKPFQPFIMFEDDVKMYRSFPESIEIPDDTDILFIGLSTWGTKNEIYGENNIVSYENIDNDIVRIYNMLALHGTMICSTRGLLAIQKCMSEGYFKDIIWDIFTAQIQPYYNVYALKNPLVYQYGKFGPYESHTKINLNNINIDNKIEPSWINKTNFSIITTYNQHF